jgi:rod shape-determining protein MreD
MYPGTLKVLSVVALSFLLAIFLTIIPLPSWMLWMRPRWIVLVAIYWALAMPFRFSVGSAWIVGLMSDIISGTSLGEQALALTIVVYFVAKFHQRIQTFPRWQSFFTIFGLIILFQIIVFLIQGLLGQIPLTLRYWAPCLTSMIFWPWLYDILQACQRYFKIAYL